ncbi:MAG: hypothetical protein RIR11_4281 [Bacteroidota bacterium]
MMVASSKKKLIRRIVVMLLWLGALYTMASLLGLFESTITVTDAEYISLGYLLLGLIFLFFNEIRLLLVCFACSAVISFLVHERFSPEGGMQDKSPIGHVILYSKNAYF